MRFFVNNRKLLQKDEEIEKINHKQNYNDKKVDNPSTVMTSKDNTDGASVSKMTENLPFLSIISESEVAKSEDSTEEVRYSPIKRAVLGIVRSQSLSTISNTINEKINLSYSKTLSLLPKKRSAEQLGDKFINPYYSSRPPATKIDFYESDLYTYYDDLIHGIVNAPKEWGQRAEQIKKRRPPSSEESANHS